MPLILSSALSRQSRIHLWQHCKVQLSNLLLEKGTRKERGGNLTWANDNKNEEPEKNGTNGVVLSLLRGCFRHSSSLHNVLIEPLHLPIRKTPWRCLRTVDIPQTLQFHQSNYYSNKQHFNNNILMRERTHADFFFLKWNAPNSFTFKGKIITKYTHKFASIQTPPNSAR